jgi:hypothetical protein
MKLLQLKYVLNETDPFYIRELLMASFFYLVVSSYVSSLDYSAVPAIDVFLQNTTFAAFTILILYGAMLSAIFARGIENGSTGFLFTTPINRKFHILLSMFVQAIIGGAIFLIPIGFVYWLTFYALNLYVLVIIYLAILALILIYLSFGYLISSITKSAVGTFILTAFFFLQMSSESAKIFKHNLTGQFILSGLTTMNLNSPFGSKGAGYVFDALVFALIMSVTVSTVCYYLLIKGNMRSGR